MALHAIAFDEGLPVFLAWPSTTAGLGFTSSQIARTLSCMAPVLLLAQFVGYPMLSRRFSPLSLWRWPAVMFTVLYPLFSLLPNLTSPSVAPSVLWIALLVLLTGRFVANVVAYTSMAVMAGADLGIGQDEAVFAGNLTSDGFANGETQHHGEEGDAGQGGGVLYTTWRN
ncbi:hypothetical protein BJX61DRAFT_540035 [Aspergillus egyptiacus]|nr:hypothetical protein BJX61DRAFT_540035 [Aspergillus egyptiacus]